MPILAVLYLDSCRPWYEVDGNEEEGKGYCHSVIVVGGVGEVPF